MAGKSQGRISRKAAFLLLRVSRPDRRPAGEKGHGAVTVARREVWSRGAGHSAGVTTSTPARPHAPVPEPVRRRLARQAWRFLVVGGVATVVDVGLFNLLHYGLHTGPLTAKVASTVAGGVVAFVGNRQWSFDDNDGNVHAQVLAFVVVSVVGLLLALAPLAFARYVLGMTGVVQLNVAANVLGLALATVFRFWGYRRFVFPPAPARVV